MDSPQAVAGAASVRWNLEGLPSDELRGPRAGCQAVFPVRAIKCFWPTPKTGGLPKTGGVQSKKRSTHINTHTQPHRLCKMNFLLQKRGSPEPRVFCLGAQPNDFPCSFQGGFHIPGAPWWVFSGIPQNGNGVLLVSLLKPSKRGPSKRHGRGSKPRFRLK